MKIFLCGQQKLKYLTDNPPNSGDSTYDDWISEDFELWDGYDMVCNLTLVPQLNFMTLRTRFGTLLRNIFRIRVILLGFMRFDERKFTTSLKNYVISFCSIDLLLFIRRNL